MKHEDERWLVDHDGRVDWHSDGRCWIKFCRGADGCPLDAHGVNFAAAMADARALDARRALEGGRDGG